ncbi:endoplasmic reticulum protein SC65-like [Halichoeres trimaculatus]|uniref:endoplasmic reticulum protein SC65-like n=1 Tax=Halichoeres trimaculatus TaxID=147232 RepID=UPI003D9F105E
MVALVTLLFLSFIFLTSAQYENYSFTNFPSEELMPLSAAYGLALDHYAAERWTDSIRYLELSLRLRRLLRDSVRYCALLCNNSKHKELDFSGNEDFSSYWLLMVRATCQKKCRAKFPALQLPPPGREVLQEFSRRSPYRYLHSAHSKMDDLQRAVPCAYTYLQRNPQDEEMLGLMEEYKSQYDLRGFLTDYEEQPHEASFLQGVKLVTSGDFSSSVVHMEEALRLYLREFDLCQAECEGMSHLSADTDFYAAIADVLIAVLQCKLKCEENLRPNVGGFFVEKFLSTVYHYLQYAYYKMNDGVRAVPCAHSYVLLEPEDRVMKQNLQYYEAYSEQWGLQPEHFSPRMEALRVYKQTVTLKQMLTSAQQYLEMTDEDFLGPEEAARLAPESPDAEFEGMGDYEESIYADWRQTKGKGDTGETMTEETPHSNT